MTSGGPETHPRPGREEDRTPAFTKVAPFNRRCLNRLFLRVAGRLPGFGIIGRVGRRSGRAYRVPVNVFYTEGGYTQSPSPTGPRATG